jgi:DNA/RNA endonuclease YhcR with UshA esterase domain
VRRELVACLRADPARPRSARVIVIADGDGTITQVTASNAEACIAPLMRAQRLPAVRQGDRQQITYTLRP